MDIVASVGYVGQSLFFIDEERFAHTTGKGIYIYDTQKGPREIVWRHDKEMLYCSVNLEAQLLTFSFKAAEQALELVKLTDINSPIPINNPFKSAIIHHEITRTGDRLYGLSDVSDHHLVLWSITSKSVKLLASKELASPCHQLIVNPCDSDVVCLYGSDGVFLAHVHEIFGDYSLKIQKIFPVELKGSEKYHGASEDVMNSPVQFVLWLPFHRLLMGLANGEVVEINTETKSPPTMLGKFMDPTQKGSASSGALVGTVAITTSMFLVVGTSIGNVYWYNLGSYLNDPATTPSFMEEMKTPARIANLRAGIVKSLLVDPSFQMLLIGTNQGTIARAKLEPEPVDPDANKNNDLENENESKPTTNTVELVTSDPIGNMVKTGLIFTSKFMTITIKKMTTRAKSTLSLLFLGSHEGMISIWRQSEPVGDMTTTGPPIRRSNPKATQDVLRIMTKVKAPIVALEVIQYGYFYILCIGFENGYLEFWNLFGCEYDEDEGRELVNTNPTIAASATETKLLEDDEGTCIVKLDATYLMKNKIYESSFNVFQVITTENVSSNSMDVLLGVTAMEESQLYLIYVIKHNQLELGKVFDVYDPMATSSSQAVSLSPRPTPATNTSSQGLAPVRIHSLIWLEDTLYTIQDEKTIIRHKLDLEQGKLLSDSKTSMVFKGFDQIAKVIFSPLCTSCLVINTKGVGYYVTLAADVQARLQWQDYRPRHLQESKDLISIANYAPNGIVFATGSIDGSLIVWRVDPENIETVLVAYTVALYSCPMINLTFSSSSTSLYTSGLDGTSLVLFVGKPTSFGGKLNSQAALKSTSASFSQPVGNTGAAITAATTFKTPQQINQQYQSTFYHQDSIDTRSLVDMDIILSNKLLNEREKELKATYKFKTMGITAALNEISQRLALLIEQNEERESIEQLPLQEFVLDLPSKRQLEQNQQLEKQRLQLAYFRSNKLLELLSARVKAYTYDKIAQPSIRVRPCLSPPEVEVNYDPEGVSSFPILKITPQKQSIMDKIKRLRRLEVKTIRKADDGSIRRIKGSNYYRCAWAANVKGIPTDISYIVDEGTNWPLTSNLETEATDEATTTTTGNTANTAANNTATAKGGNAATATSNNKDSGNNDSDGNNNPHGDDDELFSNEEEELELDETELLNLFYSPFTTRSIIQKRNQIYFLQEVIRKEKTKFNQSFQQLKNEKEETIQQIEARLTRMEEIFGELQIDANNHSEYQALRQLKVVYDDEKIDSVFTIHDSEITARPYETEAMRQQKLKEQEERLRKLANNEEELVRQRALQDMMFGTLEMKKNLLLNEDLLLQKPTWLDEIINLSEMNENQQKEYESYQQRVKQLQEEQAHYKKTLEQEWKKLKLEMIETSKTCNEKIHQMIQKKIITYKLLLANEVYISRIALTMVKSEQYQSQLKQIDSTLLMTREERMGLKTKMEDYHQRYEEMKNKLFILTEEEKAMDKSFKRDLQNLCNNTFDIESLKVFTDLYRKRVYPKAHLSLSLGDDGDGFNDRSESMDISASQSQTKSSAVTGNNTTASNAMTKRSGKDGKLGSTKGGHASSRGPAASRRSAGGGAGGGGRRLKASRGINASKETSGTMGPMQQAAQALLKSAAVSGNNLAAPVNTSNHLYDNDVIIAREKDPFYSALIAMLKKKKKMEVLLPAVEPLRLELDCPEGFVVDQFSWAKLQELRNQRIEKEIERSLLLNECTIVKNKLSGLEQEEISISNQISSLRNHRDQDRIALKDMEINLDVVVSLLQGQDEMNQDAMITEYHQGLLIPITIISKYNQRIKELGLEKITILTKIKLFRRKMNLIHWEAIHNALQLKHYENYYTDIQLFRVTKDLQKVILEGENAFNQKERCDRIQSRKDFLNKDYQQKQQAILGKISALEKQYSEKELEIQGLRQRIMELTNDVTLAKSIKDSKDAKFPGDDDFGTMGNTAGGGGGNQDYINKKMKKIMDRRRMVDIARAQAEEIDYLRQELDRMRQRTFPSFVKSTRNRVNSIL